MANIKTLNWIVQLKAAVLTVSDTRNFDTDKVVIWTCWTVTSEIMLKLVMHIGTIVKTKSSYYDWVKKWLEEDVDVIITTGGTKLLHNVM